MRRLEKRIPVFFATTFQPASGFALELGMRVDSVSAATLGTYVLNGEFNSQQHLGALAAAQRRASQWPDGMIDYTLLPGTDGRGC